MSAPWKVFSMASLCDVSQAFTDTKQRGEQMKKSIVLNWPRWIWGYIMSFYLQWNYIRKPIMFGQSFQLWCRVRREKERTCLSSCCCHDDRGRLRRRTTKSDKSRGLRAENTVRGSRVRLTGKNNKNQKQPVLKKRGEEWKMTGKSWEVPPNKSGRPETGIWTWEMIFSESRLLINWWNTDVERKLETEQRFCLRSTKTVWRKK